MKTILFMVALITITIVHSGFAQDNTDDKQAPQLLTHYYGIKDALVAGNPNMAATKANEFVKAANAMDANTVSYKRRTALIKEAQDIAKATDINKQREYFAGMSEQMFDLAKATQLSSEPIYKAYCPMKKTSWLSSEAAIKNPYYGNAMLTCGKIVETIK